MSAVIILLLAGLILLGFEVFVPGVVLGALGVAALLGGCGLAFARFNVATGVTTTVTAAVALGLMLWAELALLPKTRFGKKLMLFRTVEAKSQPAIADAAAVIGRSCEAATTLAPSGYVLLDGRRYEAWSQSGHITKGTTLRVVGVDNFRLIVTQN
jgi:membrane-bound ClpP family serine protease